MPDPLLLTCVGVAHDLPLLPHFVAHYRRLGIAPGRFRVLLNAPGPRDPGLDRARAILAREGIGGAEDWIAPYTSAAMWEARRALQQRHAGAGDWVISADVDEFHDYPAPLEAFLAACAEMDVTAVQGVFIDRLAAGGRLAPVVAAPFVLEQFPIEAEVAWSIAGQGRHHDRFGTVKLMAMRGHLLPSRGGHHPLQDQPVRHLYGRPLGRFPMLEDPAWRFRVPTRVHHVHWTDSLPDRLERRLATPGVSPAGREYGQKQIDHIARHGGVALDRVALRPAGAEPPWRRQTARLRRQARRLDWRDALRARLGR